MIIDVSEAFNNLFSKYSSKFEYNPLYYVLFQYETENSVQNAIKKFKIHLIVKIMISKINSNKKSSICPVAHNKILK